MVCGIFIWILNEKPMRRHWVIFFPITERTVVLQSFVPVLRYAVAAPDMNLLPVSSSNCSAVLEPVRIS